MTATVHSLIEQYRYGMNYHLLKHVHTLKHGHCFTST